MRHTSILRFCSPRALAAKRRRLGIFLQRNDVLMPQGIGGASADLEVLPSTHAYWGTCARHSDDAAGTSCSGTVVAIWKEWMERADIRGNSHHACVRDWGCAQVQGRRACSGVGQLDLAMLVRWADCSAEWDSEVGGLRAEGFGRCGR